MISNECGSETTCTRMKGTITISLIWKMWTSSCKKVNSVRENLSKEFSRISTQKASIEHKKCLLHTSMCCNPQSADNYNNIISCNNRRVKIGFDVEKKKDTASFCTISCRSINEQHIQNPTKSNHGKKSYSIFSTFNHYFKKIGKTTFSKLVKKSFDRNKSCSKCYFEQFYSIWLTS